MYINDISELKIGDIVRASVATYSQKYMMYEGYEEYNCTKEGTIVKMGKTFFDTIIITEDGDEVVLASNPGSSGYVIVDLIKKD
jgi:hypothetical protein